MFSTVRAKEFGSITRSKKEIGVSARDEKMGLLIKPSSGIVYTELIHINTNLRKSLVAFQS